MAKSRYPELPVLVVDDEEALLRSYRLTLNFAGIDNVHTIQDSRKVLPLLADGEAAMMLLDYSMPHVSGEEILEVVSREYPDLPVVVVTGINDLELAVTCMKKGALDYLVKPVEPTKFVSTVKNVLQMRELKKENTLLRDRLISHELKNPEAFSDTVTNNSTMYSIFQYAEMIAPTIRPVLITGESGVGKELIARAVHNLSGRSGRFVSVNVSGLDDTLLADTLFGHEKDAFTGASGKRAGLVERAVRGTLFLDEIGDLEYNSQIRLLRLLQEGEYYPLGADAPKKADLRILTATHHDLQAAQTGGKFRKDLYYRLCTHHIHLPPLRERREDIPYLLERFLSEASKSMGKKKPTVPPALLNLLAAYHFPGNIREFQGMVFDAVAQLKGKVLPLESFRQATSRQGAREKASSPVAVGGYGVPRELFSPDEPFPTVKELEKILFSAAMKRSGGNQTLASDLLGITRQTLGKHLKKKPPA